jgi:peptidoglycan/xylan/chitin deacetylase (PgdA/CDA1 family)
MFLNLFLNLSIIAGLSSALIITQCVNNKDVALTFDDGPSIGTTRRLMDYLESENIRATFHVVTKHINYVEVQEIMKDIISRGHVLGYRLEAEWTMQNVTNEGMQGAVDYHLDKIRAVTGKKPKLVRTSYNATDLVKNALVASGLIVTMPNFETYDYRSEFNYDTMIQRFQSAKLSSVISVQREFAINLFDTTKQFIQFLRENGYNIVTLQKCLQIDNIYAEDFVIQSLRTFAVNDPATATADPFEHENSSSPSKATFSSAFLFSLALVMVAIQLIL